MSEFRIDQIKSQDATRGPDVAGITTFTGTSGIVMPSGDTAYRGGRGRGLFGGGRDGGGLLNNIDYITISTLGDAQDFGDLSDARRTNMYAESATRGIFAGGYDPSATNLMDFITIQTLGNAQDFGDLPSARSLANGGTSNCVRAVFSGYASPVATIEFCQIATTGNAQSFGDLGSGARQQAGASSNGHGGLS